MGVAVVVIANDFSAINAYALTFGVMIVTAALRAPRSKLLAAVGAGCIAIAPFVFSLVGDRSHYSSLIAGMAGGASSA